MATDRTTSTKSVIVRTAATVQRLSVSDTAQRCSQLQGRHYIFDCESQESDVSPNE